MSGQKELNWATFISGGGTTMAAMLEAVNSGDVRGIRPAMVLASSQDAGGIQKAIDAGVNENDIVIIDPLRFRGADRKVDRLGFGAAINIELKRRNVDFFTQNGWLPLTPSNVIAEFQGFNQHPAPVPEFGGKGMHGPRPHATRILFAQMSGEVNPYTEAVAQRVHPDFDKGKVVVSKRIQIPDEIIIFDVEKGAPLLQKMVLPHEHDVQIELLRQMSVGRVAEKPPLRYVPFGQEHILYQAKKEAIARFPQA